jgi:O-antigen/teichoic acid export membrane protein
VELPLMLNQVSESKTDFNRMVLLTAARVFGIIFSISIPMYLGRKLSIEVYGTYKQIMLFFWFAHVALNLGLDDSAYYFLKRDSNKFPLYNFNALIFNAFATGALWLMMTIFSEDISSLAGNRDLAKYLPLLGYLTFATVCSMQIEGILIVALNRFNERLAVEVSTEFLKSLAIISAFYFFNSVYVVLIFLSILMSLRLIAVIYIIHYNKKKHNLKYRQAPAYFMQQVQFGLPLGVSRILHNILNMENFFISSYFSLVQFTYYTVGCFENPLVNAARTSMFELANIEMVDSMKNNDYKKSIEIWKSMTRKLFLIIIPFAVYMIFFAREIIVFIFSDKYLASVPFFMIFNLYLIAGALNAEPIFRATSKTFMAFKLKLLGLSVGIILMVSGAYWGGAIYALVGKIIGVLIMNIMGLVVGAHLLQTKFKNLFYWRELLSVSLISIVLSTVIRFSFINNTLGPFVILAISFSFYTSMHFFLSCWFGVIKDDEIYYLKSILNRYVIKFKITALNILSWALL